MKNIITILDDQITKLETEVESANQLDSIIHKRVIQNQRQTTLKETQIALQSLEINAAKRASREVYLYAIPHHAQIMLNSNQFYNFRFLTLQEIEFLSKYTPDDVIKLYWNKTNRLTIYSEFIDRAERLKEKIQTEKLDMCLSYSASELLYQILGVQGELLVHLEIDISQSYTTTRLNQIIQRARDNLSFFTRSLQNEN